MPGDQCDLCGLEVPADQGHRAELSVGSSMCPTPMAFHDDCWEKASALWQPDPDYACDVDPRFPETGQWPRAGAPEAEPDVDPLFPETGQWPRASDPI